MDSYRSVVDKERAKASGTAREGSMLTNARVHSDTFPSSPRLAPQRSKMAKIVPQRPHARVLYMRFYTFSHVFDVLFGLIDPKLL